MNEHAFWQNSRKMALAGFICTLPAILLVASGLLYSLQIRQLSEFLEGIGFFNVAHPLLIVGGAGLGILFNLLPVFKIRLDDGALVNTFIFKERALNWGYLLLAGSLLGIIFLYLLAENFLIFHF